MPALTKFIDGSGPVFAGRFFRFALSRLRAGQSAISLADSSGTTPKMIQREGHARLIGYGAMLLESFVGVMAMGCVRDAAGRLFRD